MKNEIMCRVQRLPKAAESNTKNGREKTQKAQEQKFPFATFVLFRGNCVNVNPPDRLGFQSVKLGQPDAAAQFGAKIYANTLT
jgi:hypothetical protein